MELWSQFQTGNIVMDSIIRSLLLGLLVGMVTSLMSIVKDDVITPVGTVVKNFGWFGRNKCRKYAVTLEGHSKTNSYMNERFIFSVEFKAILDFVLQTKCLDTKSDDVRSLVQFHTDLDIKYDRSRDTESNIYSHSFILDQDKEVLLDDGIYASVNIEKQSAGDETKSSKSIQTKTYKIVLSSDTLPCARIVEWVNARRDEYAASRTKELNKERHIVSYRGYDTEYGKSLWDADILTTRPSFDSLFFEDKEKFVETINRFLEEKEFYESVGKPWQLGINLSGPPGCGKTSFIRVLAAVLNRNVKDISFSKIKTNKDFEEAIRCVEYEGKSLSFDKTIIVAEDVDCANMDAIRTRSNSRESPTAANTVETVETASDGKNDEFGVKALVDVMKEATKNERMMYAKTEKEMKASSDALDLSTILNIMDGVKSSNGRIIVFTTNHPEKIDPALLRPGRIDLDVRFGPIGKDLIYDMCQFWYTKYSEFYGESVILSRFETVWQTHCEPVMDSKKLRPCVVHNVLQKHGKDVETAMAALTTTA